MAEKDGKGAKRPNAIVRFYQETKGELKKVSWPTRQEALHLTQIVLIVLVVMAIFLGGIDLIGATLIRLVLG